MKQKRVDGNGVFGVQNEVADDNIGYDVLNSRADTDEDFRLENKIVGENVRQDVVDSGVEVNLMLESIVMIFVLIKLNH